MKARLMAGVLAVVVAVSFSWAQEFTTAVGAGSKAMLFTFSGLSTLGAGSYNGGFGGKFYLAPNIAVRASLLLGHAAQDVLTTATTGGKDGKNSATKWGFSAGGEYHLSFARVSPFVGASILFSTSSTTEELPINVAGAPEITRENVNSVLWYAPGKTLTAGAIGGVEFFLTKELSLSAEYQLGYGFPMGWEAKTTTVTGGVTNETKIKYEGVSKMGFSNTGALTLAVYF